MTYEFDFDTVVVADGDNRYTARISDRWNHFTGPDGGYVLAIAARALAAQMPLPDPLTVSTHFLRPPAPGDVDVRTEVVRTGRRHATGIARLMQGGKELLVLLGTFGDLDKQSGRELILGEPPKLPSPEDAVDPLGAFDASVLPPLVRRVDIRMAELPGFARGEPSGDPSYEMWIRFSDGRAPDPLSMMFFVDAALPTVAEIGEMGSSTVEMSVHMRARPAPGWVAMRLRARHIQGGYHEEDAEIWDSTGRLVAQSRQLAILARA